MNKDPNLTEKYIYWEEIKEAGFLKGFFGTWFMIIFRPKLFFETVNSSHKILPPFLFAWSNMFLSALFLSFVYGPQVGYNKPTNIWGEIGFMTISIPIIFIFPVFLVSLIIHRGLLSNRIESNLRLIFRLLCYTFSAIFLLFQIGIPLARYPFSFYLVSIWILAMILFGLKKIFQINLSEAINSSIFFIIILFAISTIGFVVNNRIIAQKMNEAIMAKIAVNETTVAEICALIKQRAELYKKEYGKYPLGLKTLVESELQDQPQGTRDILFDWEISNESELNKMAQVMLNNTSVVPYGYFYIYKSDGENFIFRAVPHGITTGQKIFEERN